MQQRNSIDFAAKMNTLAYATGNYLDHIGAMLGVTRLEASNATCTAEFSLGEPLVFNLTIPAGTRITPDGKLYFATTEPLIIESGYDSGEVICQCLTAGTVGNDYVPGQIAKLVDVLPFDLQVVNIDTSSGGTDRESDEAFRERIHIAPESFTTAGSVKGYEYYALSADPNISAVSVATPPETDPGNVNIYVLMAGGVMPSDEILAKVLAACNGDDVRPDTDYVHVLRPEVVEYSVELDYWIDRDNASESTSIQNKVKQAVQDWEKWQRASLGRDINPSQLSHDVIAAGAKRCDIISPTFNSLGKRQIALNIAPSVINFAGLE